MHQHLPLHLLVSLFLAACASSPAPNRTSPAGPVAKPPPDAAPPAPAEPGTIMIAARAWPGSNTHQWGTRYLEVRGEPGKYEVRTHDVIDFQGVGMRPQDMPPTRHDVTPWVPLPETVQVPPGSKSCNEAPALCDELRAAIAAGGAPTPP